MLFAKFTDFFYIFFVFSAFMRRQCNIYNLAFCPLISGEPVLVRAWIQKPVVPPFLLVVLGACTIMDVSMPEARSQGNLSYLEMIQKRLVCFLIYNLLFI